MTGTGIAKSESGGYLYPSISVEHVDLNADGRLTVSVRIEGIHRISDRLGRATGVVEADRHRLRQLVPNTGRHFSVSIVAAEIGNETHANSSKAFGTKPSTLGLRSCILNRRAGL